MFYNHATGPQTRFAFDKDFKHCNTMCYDGDAYVLLEASANGIEYRCSHTKSVKDFIRAVRVIPELFATVTVKVHARGNFPWFPLWIRSCNEMSRYFSGVDIGVTWNPKHMYNKLINFDLKRNFEILNVWRRDDGNVRWRR